MAEQVFRRRWSDLDPDATALHQAGWRRPHGDNPPPGVPERRRSVRARDPLHVRARRSSLADERGRARELVDTARGIVTSTFDDIRFGRRIDVAALAPVVAGIAASVARHPTALPSVTRLKTIHEYTYLHSVAVCGLMIGLGEELELDPSLTQQLGLAGLLHDIGKARIPASVLDKPGPLDFDEYALVQRHTRIGVELLQSSGIDDPMALDVCLHHHERIDGGGYPERLGGDALSIHARMGAICDVYDAVTSTRAYKARWSPGEAIEWMTGAKGHFDPAIISAFRRMIGAFPLGSLVRLESQRLALVVDDGGEDPTTPDVCLVQCALSLRTLPPTRIGTRRDRIVGIERASQWVIDDWDARSARILVDAAAD